MSGSSQETRAEARGALARELRQFHGLGASFFRAAAARSGLTVTDLQVIDILDSDGPMTAGQLAELTGLTTGAITGVLNRLEEAGQVSRERDPNDGRRVIVQLAPGKEEKPGIGPMFTSMGKAWEELASRYDDEQIAFLLEFLKRSNALSQQEVARLREAPQGEEGTYSAPLGDITSARLVVPAGIYGLTLRADSTIDTLYQARFEGTVPDVKTKDGVVTIRYPKRLWMLGGTHGAAEIALNIAIPWWIAIQGGVSTITAELGGLNLAGLEVKGGMSMIHLELPVPSGMVPIHVSGGASDIMVRRPTGVPARVHLKGWVSTFVFDDQMFGNLGNDVRLQSPDYEATAPHYDIEVASSASMVTITSGER
ncbi:MAG TPA: MarR family transcriptional regulator [Ktedonobacterales bacterium]|nr:MarR family transcriptional regulator [Ktedonobacterales bacterium]